MTKINEICNTCLKCKKPNCVNHCPLETDIPKIISLVLDKHEDEAAKLLFKNNAMPYITGSLCDFNRQCFGNCILQNKKIPVKYYEIEKYLGEKYFEDLISYPNVLENKKIAIIGGGVAGLSIVHFLLKKGIAPVLYEKNELLGGVLTNTLPNFRYDKTLFIKHIKKIESLIEIHHQEVGVDIKEEIFSMYDYLVFTEGTSLNRKSINHPLVLSANEVLNQIMLDKNNIFEKEVLVIGCGNSACDVSRTLKRLGNSVTIVYRRDLENAPANRSEISLAMDEGIKFNLCVVPQEVIEKDGKVVGLLVEKQELIDNPSGGRKIFKSTNEKFVIDCDIIIDAVGSSPNYDFLKKHYSSFFNQEGWIDSCFKNYFSSSLKGLNQPLIYVGGDYFTGAKSFASALASGRDIAKDLILKVKEPTFLFGGSFNPPTLAHQAIIEKLSKLGKVIIVPNGDSYQNKTLIPFEKRVEMIKLLINEKNIKNTEISDIENQKVFNGSIETLRTLDHPIMAIGDDCLVNLKNWVNPHQLVRENYFLVFLRRFSKKEIIELIKNDEFLKNYQNHFILSEEDNSKYSDVSSSFFRNTKNFEYLSEAVKKYIIENKLYGE